ncbi:protein CFAP20DC-like [Saccostrea cucullata]|uniref:protein CFAP20DC-like n=1 Tax=Saccostrea cuccullata TaxID=36930 RepID=UPI002ED22A7F
MYKTDYQGGPFVEIFSAQGKDPLHGWKHSGGIRREYEKDVKGYLYCLEGSTTTTKIQLPKANLIQRYLVFQMFVPRGKEFSFEIGVIDQRKNKRRLMFSSAQKDIQANELHARIPLTIVRRHMWVNLCVDLVSVVGDTWRGQTYRCVESVCVSANCKLRRIFTLKTQPPDTAEDEEMYGCEPCNTGELEIIPKQCQFATDVQFVTQVLNMAKIKHAERLKGGDNSVRSSTEIDLNASGRRTSLNDSAYHIAFGTKVPGAPTASKNKGNLTNRSNRSAVSRAEDAVYEEPTFRDLSDSIFRDGAGFDPGGGGDRPPETVHRAVLHRRQLSDPATQQDLEMASRIDYEKPDLLVKPHPPREPSTDRLRRRIRVKNGSSSSNKDRGSSAGSLKDEATSSSVSGSSSAKTSSSQRGAGEEGRRQRLVSDTELVSKHRGEKVRSPGKGSEEDTPVSGSESGISLSQSYRKEYNRGDYEGDGAVMDDSLMGVINILNPGPGDVEEDEREDLGEYEESEEEQESDSGMFLFVSKPKSAPRRHVSPSQLDTEEEVQVKSPTCSKGKQQRGPKLENDFVHSSDSSFEDEETQRRKKVPGSRPTSGSSSRPHSGSTTSRPQSGASSRPTSGTTSRPHSGTTSRPHSGSNRPLNVPRPTSAKSQSISSVKNSAANHVSPKNCKNVPKPQRKDKIDLLTNHMPKTAESPELQMSSQLPTHRSDITNGSLSSRSVSRMSRKSVKEIPKDDARLSVIKSSEKPYDFTKYSAINYKMEDITDSFDTLACSPV